MTHAQVIAIVLLLFPAGELAPTAHAQRTRVLVAPAAAPDAETAALVTNTAADVLALGRAEIVRGDVVIPAEALRVLWSAMMDAGVAMALASSVEDLRDGRVRLRLTLGRRDGSGPFVGNAVVPRRALPGAVRAMLPRLVGARERSVGLRVTPAALPVEARERSGHWWIAGIVIGALAGVGLFVAVLASAAQGCCAVAAWGE